MARLMLQLAAAVVIVVTTVMAVSMETTTDRDQRVFQDLGEAKLMSDPAGNPDKLLLVLENEPIYFTRLRKSKKRKKLCRFVGYGDVEDSFLTVSWCKAHSGGMIRLDGLTRFFTFDENNAEKILLKDDGENVLDRQVLSVVDDLKQSRLAAKTECSKRTNNVKFFSVYIDCNPESESTLWSCEALVEFRLHSQTEGVSHFSRNFTNKFNFNSNNWGFPSFMEWTDILNPEKGYVKNDRVIIEAHISVQRTKGVRLNPVFDFASPHANCSDRVLVIDGVRLHVSSSYLSLYSPVFSALFFGEFRERDLNEVPVEDVILEEFLEMLHVIYPSHKAITAENVEFLLELGDKFEVQYVMEECEKFLMKTEEIPVVTKLVWADQYGLARLQDVCIRTFKVTTDIKNLKATEEYKNLSDATKAALLEKMFKLM